MIAERRTMNRIELTDAEQQLIKLLRHDQRVMLMINRASDRWHIRLEDPDTGIIGTGTGSDFGHAWDRMTQSGSSSPKLRIVRPDDKSR
jgi:hypothetical protein